MNTPEGRETDMGLYIPDLDLPKGCTQFLAKNKIDGTISFERFDGEEWHKYEAFSVPDESALKETVLKRVMKELQMVILEGPATTASVKPLDAETLTRLQKKLTPIKAHDDRADALAMASYALRFAKEHGGEL